MINRFINSGQSYKAVLFDVDSKDATVGMSCPPVQFLKQDVLDTVKTCIGENGNFQIYSQILIQSSNCMFDFQQEFLY